MWEARIHERIKIPSEFRPYTAQVTNLHHTMATTLIFENEKLYDILGTLYTCITGSELICISWIHVDRAKCETAR